mgnify:CR=1 FL=1
MARASLSDTALPLLPWSLTWAERLYLPTIVAGMAITLRHFKDMLFGRTKVTMQYPEQKWDSHLPDYYRGAPTLVRDADGRLDSAATERLRKQSGY